MRMHNKWYTPHPPTNNTHVHTQRIVYGSTKGFVSYGGFTHVGFPLRTSASPPTLYPSSLQLPLSPLSLPLPSQRSRVGRVHPLFADCPVFSPTEPHPHTRTGSALTLTPSRTRMFVAPRWGDLWGWCRVLLEQLGRQAAVRRGGRLRRAPHRRVRGECVRRANEALAQRVIVCHASCWRAGWRACIFSSNT
jgi:hypothetical protein